MHKKIGSKNIRIVDIIMVLVMEFLTCVAVELLLKKKALLS